MARVGHNVNDRHHPTNRRHISIRERQFHCNFIEWFSVYFFYFIRRYFYFLSGWFDWMMGLGEADWSGQRQTYSEKVLLWFWWHCAGMIFRPSTLYIYGFRSFMFPTKDYWNGMVWLKQKLLKEYWLGKRTTTNMFDSPPNRYYTSIITRLEAAPKNRSNQKYNLLCSPRNW